MGVMLNEWKPNAAAKKAISSLARNEMLRAWPSIAALPIGLSYEHVYRTPTWKIDEIFKQESGYYEAKKLAVENAGLFQKSKVSNEWFSKEYSAKEPHYKYFKNQAEKYLAEFQVLNNSKDPSDWGKLVENAWAPQAPLPLTGAAEFDPRTAEFVCTRYMLFMGAQNAATTRGSKDNGIDIESDVYVAQVKHLHSKVGVKALREFLGASIITGKVPVFFSKRGYTQDAIEFGAQNKMLLFSYTGTFEPWTVYSRIIQIEGMHVRWQDQSWMHSESGWSQGTKTKYGNSRWEDVHFRFMASLSR